MVRRLVHWFKYKFFTSYRCWFDSPEQQAIRLARFEAILKENYQFAELWELSERQRFPILDWAKKKGLK